MLILHHLDAEVLRCVLEGLLQLVGLVREDLGRVRAFLADEVCHGPTKVWKVTRSLSVQKHPEATISS